MRHKLFVIGVLLVCCAPSWALDQGAVESAIRRTGLNGGRYSVALVNNRQPNAGAYPDGRIMLTSGMIDFVRSEDELAAVLAHERTHVDQRHSARQGKEFLLTALLTYGIAKVAGASGDLAVGAARAAGTMRWQRFSLRDEYRADEGSVQLLARSGYQPDAMANLFGRLKDVAPVRSDDGHSLCFLNVRTHPSFDARIEAIRKVAGSTTTSQSGNSKPLPITVALRRINLEGSSYTSYEHTRQLVITELSKFVTVTERPENARYHLDLSGNIAIAPSQGARSVFTREFDIQVVGGQFAGRASFAGSLVGQDGTVYAASSKPSDESAKRISGLSARYGRWQPIAIQTQGYSSPELLVLQKLVEKGIEAWAADLMATHGAGLAPSVAEPQPTRLATSGVELPASIDCHFFLDGGQSAAPGEKLMVMENGVHVGTLRVVSTVQVNGQKIGVNCTRLWGEIPNDNRRISRWDPALNRGPHF
ncbi:MAG: M48 family metallopeptidase [Patescibacteria group bacterium]